MFRRFVLLCTS
jgi:hypothetical protein